MHTDMYIYIQWKNGAVRTHAWAQIDGLGYAPSQSVAS